MIVFDLEMIQTLRRTMTVNSINVFSDLIVGDFWFEDDDEFSSL